MTSSDPRPPAAHSAPGSPEPALRERFAVREEAFRHGGVSLCLLLPRAADELIDEAEYEADERLPYWADLWPSARALARHLLERPAPPEGPVLELGCGVALPSLALRARGAEVVATDYYADALLFARANALRNGLGELRAELLDWRHPPAGARYPTVLAADVMYERRNAEAMAALLPRITAPGGQVLLADPGRTYLGEFRMAMLRAGWRAEPLEVREERTVTPEKELVSKVGILRLYRPPPNA